MREPDHVEREQTASDMVSEMIARHQAGMHCARRNYRSGAVKRLIATTMAGLVLRQGVARWGARLIGGRRKLANGLCFKHATILAYEDPDRFIYTEGYGFSADILTSTHHAWVLDAADNFRVIDNTWKNPVLGAYLGIPFAFEHLRKTTERRGIYGVIDDWQDGYPLLEADPADYVHWQMLRGSIPMQFKVPEFDDFGPWAEIEKLAAAS